MTQETSNETTEEIPGCVLLMLVLFIIAGLFSKFPEEPPPRAKESVGKPGPTYQDFQDEYRKAQEFLNQNRLEEAEKTARKILKWAEGPLASRPLALADAAQMLAIVLYQQGRLAEAQSAWHTALTAREKVLPANHPELAHNFNSLGIVYQELDRFAEAEEAFREAIARGESHGLAPEVLARAYRGLGEIAWATGRPQEAITHLRKALEHIEGLRPQASTEELLRAGFFQQWKDWYELMVTWQSELGQVAEVLWAMEMSRARTLLDQLATAGVDLLAGLSPEEAAPLQKALADAASQLASLQKEGNLLREEHDLSPQERFARWEEFIEKARAAQSDYLQLRSKIRGASPAYRLALGTYEQPVPLEKLQEWAAKHEALVLEYFMGGKGSFVLVLPGDKPPEVLKLEVPSEEASLLGISPGPLTSKALEQILLGSQEDKTQKGLLAQLEETRDWATATELLSRLKALAQVLLPEPCRAALSQGNFRRLVILPEGVLALLPFEALVLQGEKPREVTFLLDVAPPVLYAPSATVLLELEARRQPPDRVWRSVLSVGDCQYRAEAAGAADPLPALAARYRRLGGRLEPLPYAGEEMERVVTQFVQAGLKVAWLREQSANERNVRLNLPGRQFVHFAVHAVLGHETSGSLFGALALTPVSNDPSNDGFLTLEELYSLPLGLCELIILSGCHTAVNPRRGGEAVWSLAWGFLVAGARRVVATLGPIPDTPSTVGLMEILCTQLASACRQGETPDYAAALQEAKRWVRRDPRWESPFFWAPFVLLGPP